MQCPGLAQALERRIRLRGRKAREQPPGDTYMNCPGWNLSFAAQLAGSETANKCMSPHCWTERLAPSTSLQVGIISILRHGFLGLE